MCDFSLEALKSRKAERNETLVLDKSPGLYGSKGFFSEPVGDKAAADVCAVCIAPNTVLSLDRPSGECLFGVFDTLQNTGPYYRDGIVTQGRRISLQELEVGTKATIHMPATDGKEEAELFGEADLVLPAREFVD